MSLEQRIEENTAAMLALKATIEKHGLTAAPAATTDTKRPPGRPKKEDAPPAVSFDEMKAALLKVKNEKSKDAAQALIKDVGGADKMDGIDKSKYAAVLAAATAAMAEPEAGSDDDL
jgi:hypothetical protein